MDGNHPKAYDVKYYLLTLTHLGQYYLVDKGYPDKQGYMVLYSKMKYHQSQFQNAVPKDAPEAFNKVHSSLRSCVERCFGVLKKRFRMLTVMPNYAIPTQIDLIIICFLLHNYILENTHHDYYLDEDYEDPDLPPPLVPEAGQDQAPDGMKDIRDAITQEIWRSHRFY